ncbi:hypothetical protein D9M68_424490 [compost metagenome]
MARSGPKVELTFISAASGTISPEVERTFSMPTSSARARYGASAWTRTEYVRPNLLKSLAYRLPR